MQGKKLVIADTLSRAPVEPAEATIADIVEEHVDVVESSLHSSDRQLQVIREETLKDEQLRQLLGVLRSSWPKSRNALPLVVQPFWDNRQLFMEIEGLLLRGTQMVIPRSMRPEMLQRPHEGHLGVVKSKAVSGK